MSLEDPCFDARWKVLLQPAQASRRHLANWTPSLAKHYAWKERSIVIFGLFPLSAMQLVLLDAQQRNSHLYLKVQSCSNVERKNLAFLS